MPRPSHPLEDIYQRLLDHFGPQDWWPGETPFEVMVGAVLTQNTAWTNVEKAIANLKADGLLSFEALLVLPLPILAERIRPCGYFNLKAGRLHTLLSRIATEFGDLERCFAEPLESLRPFLLSVKGIGPETADSILLYAAAKPTFVVDAYTHRILSRHGLLPTEDADYHAIQERFLDVLPRDIALFNEYHALIVCTGKEFCKKSTPRCEACPLSHLPRT